MRVAHGRHEQLHKTWLQFKLDFAAAHRELRLSNQTAQQRYAAHIVDKSQVISPNTH
jgi:hypothetical protein